MGTLLRRTLLSVLPTLAAVPAMAQPQPYPARPLRGIVPFPPGGAVDVFARLLAPSLGTALGQAVVVENLGGAASRLGTQAATRAAPDGHTLLITNDSLAAIEAVPPPGAAPLLPGLQPVTLAITAPNLFVTHPRSGIPDIRTLVSRLGRIHVGTPGVGTSHHLTSELFSQSVGVRPEHVPYRGGGPLLADLVAGTVDAGIVTLGAAIDHIRDGRLVPLAVTSRTRAASAPEVPTLHETVGPGFELLTWLGLLVPARTPEAVALRLHAATLAALADGSVRERLAALGFDIAPAPAERFRPLLEETVARFAAVAAAVGIRGGEA